MAFISTGGSGTVNDGDISNAKLANMAQATVKGRASGAGTGVPVDLTAAQQKTILGISAFAETILDDADAAAVRATIGAGTVATGSVDNAVLRADGTGGATTQGSPLIVGDATTYSSQVYVQTRVDDGSTTNIHAVVSPKGNAAFILGPSPDGTITGGNNRGQYAVDLQLQRTTGASLVASGNYSAVLGGLNSFATGLYSVSHGQQAGASGSHSFAHGNIATASGQSAVCNGRDSTASGDYTYAGGWGASASRRGQVAYTACFFAAAGDAQFVRLTACTKTTNATPTEMRLDGNGGTARITIPSGKVCNLLIQITGAKSDGTAVANYTRQVGIKNVAGTTSLVGSILSVVTDTEDNNLTDVAITADDTNDALAIAVTGIAGETWRWCAVISGVEIAYGT
jgi:hypothetical protein